ncbi:MAG: GAF domain-containing protein, partial [Chloroflexota bacterium]
CTSDQDCDPTTLAIRTDCPVIIKDIARCSEYPSWKALALKHKFRSCAALPMHHAGRVVGALSVCARPVNAFSQEEIVLLQELAEDLAYAKISIDARSQQVILQAAATNMQDGLVIADLQGNVIYVNPASTQVVNFPWEQITGRNIFELAQTEESQKVIEAYRQALLTRGQISAEFESKGADGRSLFVALRASLVYDAQKQPTHVVFSVQDITLRRQYEHQLLTLNHIVNELVQIYDLQDLMQTLLRSSEALLRADASGIYLIKDNGPKIIQTLTHNLAEEYANRIASDIAGLPGESAFKSHKPVYVEDVLSDPKFGSRIHFIAEFGLRSLLILPVLFHSDMIGALVVYNQHPRKFGEEELQLGQTLAHTLAIAIHNARLYQAEHSQRELAEALAQAAAVLNSSLYLDQVLDEILEQTMRVVSCSSANIMLVDGDEAYIARRRGYGDEKATAGAVSDLRLPLEAPSLKHILTTGLPLLISNTENDPLWPRFPGSEQVKSYAGAPLQINHLIAGFLNVDSDQPNFFTLETTLRLQAFAAHAAIAIQNASLYHSMQKYANELEDRVQDRTAELQAAKESIEGILASVPDAVIVLDEAGRLIQANQAGESLLAAAAIEKLDLFAPELLSNLGKNATPSEKTVLAVQNRAFQPLSSPLTIQGKPSGQVLVFRDVTRFRELDQMKTKFVSDVSHELRTPLTNLTIYLDLLSNVTDHKKSQSYIETLRRETGRLTHLIEDLLTISRLEAGRVEIFIKQVDVNRLITELVQDRLFMANSHGLLLSCETAPHLPYASADVRMLMQAISNLLTNAINYTPPEGAICLRSAKVDKENQAWVTISIIDNGVGIPPGELPLIFDRFFRGTASFETKAPGTGLGLPISKEIIERMGGTIEVESELGSGSTFTVWLRAVL